MNTSELIEVWRGVPIRTRRLGSTFTVGTSLTKLLGANPRRHRIAIQSDTDVAIQHSFDTDNEEPITVPAGLVYLEDFEGDDEQVTTEFWAVAAAPGAIVNVIERILE